MIETENMEVLVENMRTDGRREWASAGTWLYPGERLVVLYDICDIGTAPTTPIVKVME